MTRRELEQGAIYVVEEGRGFGVPPVTHVEVEFVAVREGSGWPTEVYEFQSGDGELIHVPVTHLTTARKVHGPE